jgi:hypothetical protein
VIELTATTREHIRALFAPQDVADAERVIAEQCAETLPLVHSPTPAGLERIRFAVIRMSAGDLTRLRGAIREAQIDWRDVLVAAGFADDPRAHEHWRPQRFDAAAIARWTSGHELPGVLFALDQAVAVIGGPSRGRSGTVVSLLALEPEPRYRVALDSGVEGDTFQRWLAPVSPEARELLLRAYAAFNARDVDAALATMRPDVEWPNGMDGGLVRGHDAVRAYWTRQWAAMDPRVDPMRVAAEPGGRVVVEARQVVRDLAGRVTADRVVRHVYTLRDGLIASMAIRA